MSPPDRTPGGPPLIGITSSEMRRKEAVVERTPQGEPPQVELALGLDYMRAVERAGGIPVVLPPLQASAVAPLLGGLAGVCLSGGPDLDPAVYGAGAHPEAGPFEPEVDRFELAVAGAAWELGMPVLAICRGAQALNVSRGGSLVQHLPDLGLTLLHRQQAAGNEVTHEVRVASGTLLARIVGSDAFEVNSFHHQAVERLGDGLEVSAASPDGVIEAIEAVRRPFVVGVQWHAESLADRPEHAALFEGLVRAARVHSEIAARKAA